MILRTFIEISVILDDSERPKRTGVGGSSAALSVRGSFLTVQSCQSTALP